jgi:hypothetical protein
MTKDPRVALEVLVSSLEEHLSAIVSRRGEEDPAVDAAFLRIADAFEDYEDALYEAYGEVTPLDLYDDDEDDDDDSEDDEDDSDEDADDAGPRFTVVDNAD